MASKIVTMCNELNFAKDRFQKNQIAKEEEKKKIIENKLMPKGYLLLKKQDQIRLSGYVSRIINKLIKFKKEKFFI